MKIVVLTGAGVSAESGLKTFRDADGLWEGHRVEDVCSPEAFERNPRLVYDFYNQRRRQLQEASIAPNSAHISIAVFEHRFPSDFLLVTQNVDNLHERAGSRQILHMHGELLSARCLDTGKTYAWHGDIDEYTPHPEDPLSKGRLRPNIVWFGEMPLHMNRIISKIRACDVFVAIGTSGNVYPAAGFVSETRPDCRRIEINAEQTQISSAFDEHYIGPATKQVPLVFEMLSAEA